MRTYHGRLEGKDNPIVTVVGREGKSEAALPVRLDLANHSPDGFSWGYNGSGPAQLALALLAHSRGDYFAKRHYQQFKDAVIAKLDKDVEWTMTTEQIIQQLITMGVLADDEATGMCYEFTLSTELANGERRLTRDVTVVALNTAQAWQKLGAYVQRYMDGPGGRRVTAVTLEN